MKRREFIAPTLATKASSPPRTSNLEDEKRGQT
jgi:hypothetical protein